MSENRKSNLIGMVIASAILLLGVPGAVYLGNGYNALVSTNQSYSEIENTTAFQDQVVWKDVETEGAIASGTSKGANFTEETPIWDTTKEWDQVTFTTTAEDGMIRFNVNKSVGQVLKSSISGLRIKTNCSLSLDIKIYAVKWDGTKLTRVEAFSKSLDNGSEETEWVITPMDILYLQSQLNPDTLDDEWIQIEISGNGTDKLTTGSVLQFQFAWEEPDNPFALGSFVLLQSIGVILLIVFTVLGVIATPWVNVSDFRKKGGRK